jgi:DNA-directed RNA polymerase subunit beta
VFKSVFPIKDFNETSELEFVSYNLEKPKYDVDECRQRGMTFAAPIKVTSSARRLGRHARGDRRAQSSATSRSRRSTSARSR